MMNAYAKCNLPYPEPYTQRVTAFPVAKAPAELAFPSLPAGGMLVWGYSDAPTEFQKLHPTQQPDARWVVWVSASHPEASLARPKLLTTAKKYQRADGSVVFVGTP